MKCFLVRFCSVFYHFFYFFTLQANLSLLKEQCHGDFSSPVFFIKQFLLVPIDMPRNYFEFFRIFVEFFVFVIDSPLLNTESRLESLRLGNF
jgi:hypothetical protein